MLNGVEDEWFQFINTGGTDTIDTIKERINNKKTAIPKCSDIYISTKTKISYLNKVIDLNYLYWLLPIIEYHNDSEGIIKKQMKFQCTTKEDVDILIEKASKYYYYKSDILCCIDNPNGKIKFKDTRKISIGICRKDILNTRCKIKSAFYNCFVVVFRIKQDDNYKEIHIKIFNTGKLEIPGIKDDKLLNIVLDKLIYIISKTEKYTDINYINESTETVLINSNFNCGYFISREKLYDILRNKYNINCCYDPCSYPGIQSDFYYNICDDNFIQNGCQPITNREEFIKISFMIFRTGSVLMVGKCSEEILKNIYIFIRNVLEIEYYNICIEQHEEDLNKNKNKQKKHKKKIIYIK
tara:strand:- start:6827 stop:7888 length:1062 start_codon:yes stop_codon:yes gene_type:complete